MRRGRPVRLCAIPTTNALTQALSLSPLSLSLILALVPLPLTLGLTLLSTADVLNCTGIGYYDKASMTPSTTEYYYNRRS